MHSRPNNIPPLRKVLRIATVFFALLSQTAVAQQPVAARPSAPASIEGIVTTRDSGEPIARANVELRREPTPSVSESPDAPPGVTPDSKVVTTASDGRFVIRDVPPGTYRLYATRSNGYVPGEYGQRTPTGLGVPFTVAAGQRMSGVSLVMTPTASISGRVIDGNGEPSGYAHVQALKAVYPDGRRTLTVVQLVQADERGAYRLFWLPPGEYYVAAKPLDLRRSSEMMHIPPPSRFGDYQQQMRPTVTAINNSRLLDDGTIVEEQNVQVYYPGTRDERKASAIVVKAGQSFNGVDLNVAESLVRTQRIRGVVINGVTGLPTAASLQIIPQNPPAILLIPTGAADDNGRFDMWGALPSPGYLIADGPGLSGLLAFTGAGADINGATLTMWPGFNISGRVRVDGRAPTENDPDVTGVRVTLRRNPAVNGLPDPASFSNSPRTVRFAPEGAVVSTNDNTGPGNTANGNGEFALNAVPPGDFSVVVGVTNDAYVEAIRFGARDVLQDGLHVDGPPDRQLEIVLGLRGGALDGAVLNAKGDPAFNATVVAIPASKRDRDDLFKTASTDISGKFQMRGLAPGDYEVLAWEEVQPGAWHDPEFLRRDEGRGQRVHVDEGSKTSSQITLIPEVR